MFTTSVLSPAKVNDMLDIGDQAMKQQMDGRHVSFMADGWISTWAGCSSGAREVRLIPNEWPLARLYEQRGEEG